MPSTKKRLRFAPYAVEGTTERGSGLGGFRGLGTRSLSSKLWATWLPGSSSGLVRLALLGSRSGGGGFVGTAYKFSFLCTLFYLAFVVFCLLYCAILNGFAPQVDQTHLSLIYCHLRILYYLCL